MNLGSCIAPIVILALSNVFMTFAGFSVLSLGEKRTVTPLVGFAFIGLGAFFIFKGPLGG